MRNLSILLILCLILSCNNNKDLSPGDQSDFRELSHYKDYAKIADTSYVKDGVEPTHRITHLKNNRENLILFKRISFKGNGNEHQTILDTLSIRNLDGIFSISIGYCEMPDSAPEEIIAIVERTKKDTIQTIAKAWKANARSGKIEKIQDLNTLMCLSEF